MIIAASSECLATLEPFFPRIQRVVENAWRDWITNPFASQMQHKRVRATNVWNQLIVHSRREFDGDSAVRVAVMQEWEGLLFKDKIFLRVKKGTRELLSRNYPTKLALAFNDQGQDLFEGIIRLDLIYVLDASESEIEKICIVLRHRNRVLWALPIKGGPDAAVQNVLPFAPVQPAGPSVAERVLKSKRKQTRGGDEKRRSGDR
jgi:hypothetical protein